MKRCKGCKELKKLEDFRNNKSNKDGLEFECKRCMSKATKTFIYIITNPAWRGWVKIGRSNNPRKRCENYNTNSPLRDYKLEYYAFVDNIRDIEMAFIDKYSDSHNEWFYISVKEARDLIEKHIDIDFID